MNRRIVRLWPLVLAIGGVGMLAFSAWRMAGQEVDEFEAYDDVAVAPTIEPPAAHRFHEVAAHEVKVYEKFKGRVRGEGTVEIRAPKGMRVPVVKIHKEHGEFVDKGELLLTLSREQVDKAIVQAKAAGEAGKVARFESYLNFVELRAPMDAQVLEIHTDVGATPIDVGIPLMVLADRSSWSFVVMLPESVLQSSAALGTKLKIELEAGIGTVVGTVNSLGETTEGRVEALSGHVSVILGLDAHEGVEKDLVGIVSIATSVQTAALVPKGAVEWRGDIPFVRVAEGDELLERTLKIDGEVGGEYVVLYGVNVGEFVVVPGK